MTKSDKKMGLPKTSDEKRKDPSTNIHVGRKTKKKYPPYFRISNTIFPSKLLRHSSDWHYVLSETHKGCFEHSPDYRNMNRLFNEKRLDEALAIYAEHHPETVNWPVRFIGIQPMETKREVLI